MNPVLARALFMFVAAAPTAGVLALWSRLPPVDGAALGLFLVSYALCAFGGEVGFHRCFSHRSFEAVPAVRALLVILGCMSAQGPAFLYAAVHRTHHKHADADGDPHSPRHGLLHAYVGWIYTRHADNSEYARIPDLLSDPVLRVFAAERWYFPWVILGQLLPAAAGALLWGGTSGAFAGWFWGGLLRVALWQHSFFLLNTVGHLLGTRPYETSDGSRNNALLALPTFGVGWHNNHHARPSSPFCDHRWWQLDPGAWTIRALVALGWAKV